MQINVFHSIDPGLARLEIIQNRFETINDETICWAIIPAQITIMLNRAIRANLHGAHNGRPNIHRLIVDPMMMMFAFILFHSIRNKSRKSFRITCWHNGIDRTFPPNRSSGNRFRARFRWFRLEIAKRERCKVQVETLEASISGMRIAHSLQIQCD